MSLRTVSIALVALASLAGCAVVPAYGHPYSGYSAGPRVEIIQSAPRYVPAPAYYSADPRYGGPRAHGRGHRHWD